MQGLQQLGSNAQKKQEQRQAKVQILRAQTRIKPPTRSGSLALEIMKHWDATKLRT